MFKYSEEIGQVNFFEIDNEDIYYVTGSSPNERVVTIRSKDHSFQLTSPNKVFSIRKGELSKSVWANTRGKAIQFFSGKSKTELSDITVLKEVTGNRILGLKEGVSNFILWDIVNNKLILELPFSTTIFQTENIFLFAVIFNENLDRKKLTCYNLDVLKIEWEFDLAQYQRLNDKQIEKIITTKDNGTWLALSEHILLRVNSKTGKLEHQFKDIENIKSNWLTSAIPEPKVTIYDYNSDYLVGLMFEFFWRIKSGGEHVEFEDLTEYFSQNKIRNDKPDFLLLNEHIFFISRNDSKIGALCLESRKLDWVFEFAASSEGIIPEIIEIKGNKKILGAIDRSKKLHVFKRI